MLRVDRICVYIIFAGFIFLIPSVCYIMFIDELCAALFGMLTLADSIINGNWKRYKVLWIAMAIMTFYALYSTQLGYNTPAYFALDWILELKPIIPLLAILGIAPAFTPADKTILKNISLVNATIMAVCLFGGRPLIVPVVFHPAYCGSIIFVSCMMYLYCSITPNGKIEKKDIFIIMAYLAIGALCAKAKYYGIAILTIYFLFIYKPGIMRQLKLKHGIAIVATVILILVATWKKIDYYFLSGNSETFDPEVIHSFARPVLYATSGLILIDHFPFGSGLGSFATYASQANYSNLYYEYGINRIHGLSPNMPDFICDAYYPSLAQFGVFGVFLFIMLWVYLYGFLKLYVRISLTKYKYEFITGSLLISFILIENLGSTLFTQSVGFAGLCLLGVIAGQAKSLKESSMVLQQPTSSSPSSQKKI